MTTTPKALPDLIVRLSDEADLCRNEGADDIARLLDEAVQALNALKPADHLASAGGVEVVAYLVSGGRIFKDQAVTHKDSARTRIAERKDGSVAHPLVKQSDYLAALSKEREVADGLAALLEETRDDVSECLNGVLTGTGLDRYERRIASYQDQLARIDAALTAHRESRGGK